MIGCQQVGTEAMELELPDFGWPERIFLNWQADIAERSPVSEISA
jgi:hypothetical protein